MDPSHNLSQPRDRRRHGIVTVLRQSRIPTISIVRHTMTAAVDQHARLQEAPHEVPA